MLSDDLLSLRVMLTPYLPSGVALRPSRLHDIIAVLDQAIADAEALEACYVMTAGQEATAAGQPVAALDDIPGNVASIEAARARRRDMRFWVPVFGTQPYTPTDPGTGGAA